MCAAISRATPAACASASWLASVTAGLPPLLLRAGPALRAAAAAGLLPADRPGAVRAAPRRRARRLGGGDGDLIAGVRRLVLLLSLVGQVDVGGAGVRPDRSGRGGRDSGRGAAWRGHGRGGALGRAAARRPPLDPDGQLLV